MATIQSTPTVSDVLSGTHDPNDIILGDKQDIITKESLIQRSKDMSPYFLDGLFSLRDIDIVTDIRGYGMLGGIDIRFYERPGRQVMLVLKNYSKQGVV